MSKEFYYPFPKEPNLVKFDNQLAYKYLEPFEVNRIIHSLASKFEFYNFDIVLVNMNGGLPLYKKLAKIKKYKGSFYEVEYHRPDNSIGSNIVRAVPDNLRGKTCLLIDDIADRKTTFKSMLETLSPQSLCVTLVTKRGVPNQVQIPNLIIGAELDNIWLAGFGMNIDYPDDPFYQRDAFRNYKGIVARPPNEVLSKLNILE